MSHSAKRNKRKDMWGNEDISDKRARFFEENGNGRRRFEDANQTGSTANVSCRAPFLLCAFVAYC